MNRSILFLALYALSYNSHALEKIYDFKIDDSKEVVIEKLKANKIEAKVEVIDSHTLAINFDSPQTFTVTDTDVFEKIQTGGPKDIVNHKLVLGDPKTGRIFHLSPELKVSQVDLIQPWKTKEKLKSLKTILTEMNSSKIERRSEKRK